MKNIKNIVILLIATIPVLLISCDEDGYDDYGQDGTPAQEMSGEWFIDIIDGASGDVLATHTYHETYDNNEGNSTMVIDDHQNGWWLKGNVNINLNDLTFSVTDEPNQNDEGSTFNITEGKILKNAAHSPTGAVVDSIYFKGEFSYDPGTIIIFSGYKRTGFLEEE